MGLLGMGGGIASRIWSGSKPAKFTINGSAKDLNDGGYSSPVTILGGAHYTMVVTDGPFVATVKLWGGGGCAGREGGAGGPGGYIKGEFEFIKDATYYFVKGGGGKRSFEGRQPYGEGGEGRGPNNAYPGGRGCGGGGYSAFFKAPAPTPEDDSRTQEYAILVAGGGGGAANSNGEAGGYTNYKINIMGGCGGSAMPPAEPPYATNFGGAQPPATPPQSGPWPSSQLPVRANGAAPNGEGGAPRPAGEHPNVPIASYPNDLRSKVDSNQFPPTSGIYGGDRNGGYPNQTNASPWTGYGFALYGADGANQRNNYGGGSGGGGGYWGGGGGGNTTNASSQGGGGGAGYVQVTALHPEGVACPGPSIEGYVGLRANEAPTNRFGSPGQPITDSGWYPVYRGANWTDPDWENPSFGGTCPYQGGTGNAGFFGGDNYGSMNGGPQVTPCNNPSHYTDANAAGWSGKIVIKAPS